MAGDTNQIWETRQTWLTFLLDWQLFMGGIICNLIANNTCNVLLSLSICRENCPKIIFTFFYLNRNDPLREVFCGGEQLERRCEEKDQQRAHPNCSQPFQTIFMSSEKSPKVMDGERWPCMRIPHHPRNILLCPVKCNIKNGTVAYWQNTLTWDFYVIDNKQFHLRL